MNINAPPGSKVVFTGCSDCQRGWGEYASHDALKVGETYTVKSTEVHSWHTRVRLEEVAGEFNSVCFEDAPCSCSPGELDAECGRHGEGR